MKLWFDKNGNSFSKKVERRCLFQINYILKNLVYLFIIYLYIRNPPGPRQGETFDGVTRLFTIKELI